MLEFKRDAIISQPNGFTIIGHPMTGWKKSPLNLCECLLVSRFNEFFPYSSSLVAITKDYKFFYWLKDRGDSVDITNEIVNHLGISVASIKGIGALSNNIVIHTNNMVAIILVSVSGSIVSVYKHDVPDGIESVGYGNDFALVKSKNNKMFWLLDRIKFRLKRDQCEIVEETFTDIANIKQIYCNYVYAYLLMNNGSVYRRQYNKYCVDEEFKLIEIPDNKPITDIVLSGEHIIYISAQNSHRYYVSPWLSGNKAREIKAMRNVKTKQIFQSHCGTIVVVVCSDDRLCILHDPGNEYTEDPNGSDNVILKHLSLFDGKNVTDIIYLDNHVAILLESGKKSDIPSLFGIKCSDNQIYWIKGTSGYYGWIKCDEEKLGELVSVSDFSISR